MTLPLFQKGFRLFDGSALNAIVTQVNALTTPPGSPIVNTAISTAGAGTLTAAGIVGSIITRTGPTAAYTDTTATATQIISALSAGLTVGASWILYIENATKWVQTFAAGSGVTLSGLTTNSPWSTAIVFVRYSAANAVTFNVIATVPYSREDPTAVVGTADNGTTQTLTAAMITGGQFTSHVSTGGTTPSLTLPLGTAMDTAMPDFQVGQSYLLRVINSNSGTATIVTNTGWTLTGTLTLATNTTREFVVTKTGTATYTAVNVGTGTNS